MYEHRKQKLISPKEFRSRAVRQFFFACGLILASLGIGVVGYHVFGGLTWIDSLLDASMILGGMGPVHSLDSDGAKLFASFYALFSGLMFIGVAGFILAPFVHRMLHRFHYDDQT